MFYGCPLTGTLDFGTRISEIEDNALSSNSREELVIPENIIYFGKLSYCHNLKKIYLPNRSITIGLFSYLDNLEELHLGGTKNFVCSERMYSENLRLITVSGNNEYLYTENGILYDKKTNAIIKCPPKLDIKKVEINVKPAESAFEFHAVLLCRSYAFGSHRYLPCGLL